MARGPAACAFCCLESALLVQPRKKVQTAKKATIATIRHTRAVPTSGFLSERSIIFTGFSPSPRFSTQARREVQVLDVSIVGSVAATHPGRRDIFALREPPLEWPRQEPEMQLL